MEENSSLKKNMFYFPIYRWLVIRQIALHQKVLESNIFRKYSEKYNPIIDYGIKNNISPNEVTKKIIENDELLEN